MSSILIKNGLIYDGLGNKPFHGSILVEGEQIVKISSNPLSDKAEEVIDASGKAVTPGFIDIHRHCDAKPFYDKCFGEAIITQGITTTVVGNCGISMTPSSSDPVKAAEMYAFDEAVLGPIHSNSIHTYHDYVNALDRSDLPINFASMIGTGSVKITVKGFSNSPFTDEEMNTARNLVEEAMIEGAAGVSIGIMYLPECYSTAEEYGRLLEPVGRYGGIVTAHIRGEGDSLVDSVREVISIGKQAGCPIEISHFKSCGMTNWRKEIHRAIDLINEARANGQDVTCDFYPYEGGSTALTTMLPPAFVNGNMNRALGRLGADDGVKEFINSVSLVYKDWDNYAISLGWDRILISGVAHKHNEKYLGKTVADAAKEFGFQDAAAFAAWLMHDEDGKTAIINMSMCQEDIDTVAKLPYSIVISDSIYAETSTPHPRMYGSFPKIIREYVREKGLFTLEEAIHKMTYLPAKRMNLKARGMIKEGCFADINIFSPDKFQDNATFSEPTKLATGLDLCIINGKIALRNGAITNVYPGKNIRIKR